MTSISNWYRENVIEPPEPEAQCMDCGMEYKLFPLDAIVSNEDWEKLTFDNERKGVLCANCLLERASAIFGKKISMATIKFK